MCGICGIIERNKKTDKSEIEKLNNAMTHRGPDGEGYRIYKNYALAQRRLAIIDLSTGQQPMPNEEKTIWITFNGEIYNYLEIKKELQEKGHKFSTKSDTEVIIHGYEEWGYEILKRLRGMFAFCIYDEIKNIAFLARDHMGIKPLVYFQDNSRLVFASEIKALKEVCKNSLSIDVNAIDQYFWLQYIPAPMTIFKEIKKLPPGYYILYSPKNGILEKVRYWDISFIPDNTKSKEEWLEILDDTLSKSVKAHLMSDVPFGAFLSGGIDSTTVVKYMAHHMKEPVKTFSIGFEEADYDEREYARTAAKKLETEHYEEIVKPDVFNLLPELVAHYGEPFGDSSSVPTYYVSKLARKHVTMALSGDGGDELFAGYDTYKHWYNTMKRNRELTIIDFAKDILRKYYYKRPTAYIPRNLNTWLSMVNYMNAPLRKSLWREEYSDVTEKPLSNFKDFFKKTKNYNDVNVVQYMDIKTYLPFDIMTKVDIASMMNSLESRTPIIDKDVAELAGRIPQNYNIAVVDGCFHGKLLMKKLLEKDFSKEFIYRQKKGFAMPINKWIVSDKNWKSELCSRLLDNNARIYNFLKPEGVKNIISADLSGPIWLLLFLEEWLNQNL